MFRKPRRTHADFREEVKAHLTNEAECLVSEGMSRDDARAAARREFGNLLHAEERFHESGRVLWLDHLLRDVRVAARSLAKSRGLTLAAVLILTLGIGANTAIFTVINALMLRTLPVHNPEELVLLDTGHVDALTYPVYTQLRDRNTVLSHLSGSARKRLSLGESGDAQSIQSELVSGNFFATLGLNPVAGRLLGPDDDRPGTPLVCVINHGLWKQRFAGDPAVVGRNIRLNAKQVIVVGVAPAGFEGTWPGDATTVWLPLSAAQSITGQRGRPEGGYDGSLMLLGRRKPAVSLDQARAALQVLFRQLEAGERLYVDLTVESGARGPGFLRKMLAGPVAILMATTVLVLMLACANLATLLLARGVARRRDIAVRLMLGSGRGRLIASMLVEALLVAGAGAALGLLFSRAIVHSFTLLAPVVGGMPARFDAVMDWRVVLFSALTAMATAVLFGLAPAVAVTRMDPLAAFRAGSGRGHTRMVLRKSLVTVQVALSVVLLCGAGLFTETLRAALNLRLGFQPDNLILIKLDPVANGYSPAGAQALYDEVLERVRALPIARSAAFAQRVPGWPGSSDIMGWRVLPEGHSFDRISAPSPIINHVSPAYFHTMHIPLVAGREFNDADREGGPGVVMVNRSFAARFWPGESGVGRHLLRMSGSLAEEIVGVVPDQPDPAFKDQHYLQVYYPAARRPLSYLTLHVRVNAALAPAVETLRAEIRKIAPNLPVTDVKTMEGQLRETVSIERLLAVFTAAFGVLALLLAGIGLYGIVAYEVVQRTREVGIRIALGAPRTEVLRLVVAQAGLLTSLGLAIGLPAAVGAARVAANMLHGVRPYAITTYLVALAVLVATSVVSALAPACRALSVDPATALRYD